jgi:hypothetical protein
VAEEAKALASSSSRIVLEGEPRSACLFDLGKIERDFGLVFQSTEHIRQHLAYLLKNAN